MPSTVSVLMEHKSNKFRQLFILFSVLIDLLPAYNQQDTYSCDYKKTSSNNSAKGWLIFTTLLLLDFPGNTACVRAVVGGPAMAWPLFLPQNFFYYSLPFKVTAQPSSPLRQHFDTTWPDHFSKADYNPACWLQKFPPHLTCVSALPCEILLFKVICMRYKRTMYMVFDYNGRIC